MQNLMAPLRLNMLKESLIEYDECVPFAKNRELPASALTTMFLKTTLNLGSRHKKADGITNL